ncbi:hypothetical protein M5E88_09785 [Akkermansia muciniphila]|nr:hypothetical protein M5E88_09785 [Akkermansia muciniphila]
MGRQSFVETGYVLQLITRSLSSKNLLTEEQSGKIPGGNHRSNRGKLPDH